VIGREILNTAQENPTGAAIIDSQRTWTYSDLARAASSIASSLPPLSEESVGIWCKDVPTFVAALVATDSRSVRSVLFSAALSSDQVIGASASLRLRRVLTDTPSESRGAATEFRLLQIEPSDSSQALSASEHSSSQVILFTSGTSGVPKPAVHTWRSLSAGISQDEKYAGRKWLLAYDPTSFAGTQVWLQALLTNGAVCVPPLYNYSAIVRFLVEHQIDFASATPTFWRMLLHAASPQDFALTSLAQITLGGEAVDQTLLDALRRVFPTARITHIYASTEMGSCFAVHDGLAGFPLEFLDDPKRSCELRISNSGELEIRSRRSMLGYLDRATGETIASAAPTHSGTQWFATGDLVDRRDNRVYFIGRKSETINVGGAKVYPLQVEECIRSVEGVETVYVHGIASSLTGQLVCAEVLAAADFDENSLRRNILETCRARLSRQQIPAVIKFRDRLAINSSAKIVRNEVACDR
jgi:acyl-CoA synthetase (AMP-forming)/AMP-acid ligase II